MEPDLPWLDYELADINQKPRLVVWINILNCLQICESPITLRNSLSLKSQFIFSPENIGLWGFTRIVRWFNVKGFELKRMGERRFKGEWLWRRAWGQAAGSVGQDVIGGRGWDKEVWRKGTMVQEERSMRLLKIFFFKYLSASLNFKTSFCKEVTSNSS